MTNDGDYLKNLINQGAQIKNIDWRKPDFEVWKGKVIRYINKEFGEDSVYSQEIKDVLEPAIIVTENTPDSYWIELHQNTIDKAIAHLTGFLEDLQNNSHNVADTSKDTTAGKVFLVHGRDYEALLELDRILSKNFNLDTIILSDMPGKGRTLIEKFEEEAKLAVYAFVLLTPDENIQVNNLNYVQARPNVIFELGWFHSRLGRDKVCIIMKKGTSIHSDLDGISRIEFNTHIEEKYKELETELRHAKLIT